MKWLNPKALLPTVLGVWILLLAAYILIVEITVALVRYWYVALFVAGLIVAIWVLVRRIRRRLDRW